MKCNNCDAQATYFFASFGAATQYFCEPCVPWSLQDRLSAGELSKIEDITAPFEPTPLEEPVVEDAPVDPAPTQTKPKKTKTAVVKDVLPDTADTVDSNVPNN